MFTRIQRVRLATLGFKFLVYSSNICGERNIGRFTRIPIVEKTKMGGNENSRVRLATLEFKIFRVLFQKFVVNEIFESLHDTPFVSFQGFFFLVCVKYGKI